MWHFIHVSVSTGNKIPWWKKWMGTPILSIPLDIGIDWNKCKINCLHNIRESWIPQQTSIKSASSLPKPQNLLERNNEKHLKTCWITAYLVAYCARDYHTNKYAEPYPENPFFLFSEWIEVNEAISTHSELKWPVSTVPSEISSFSLLPSPVT